jgi:uncharacterized membrane protein HdeD (DUF308 family)
MAKVAKVRQAKKSKQEMIFPFEKENYVILAIGVLLIIVGYIALSEKTVDGTMPLVVAPILLVLGYCVVIPVGILFRKKNSADGPGATGAQQGEEN